MLVLHDIGSDSGRIFDSWEEFKPWIKVHFEPYDINKTSERTQTINLEQLYQKMQLAQEVIKVVDYAIKKVATSYDTIFVTSFLNKTSRPVLINRIFMSTDIRLDEYTDNYLNGNSIQISGVRVIEYMSANDILYYSLSFYNNNSSRSAANTISKTIDKYYRMIAITDILKDI